jgi:O-antigen/teichoic acid export membrane protein
MPGVPDREGGVSAVRPPDLRGLLARGSAVNFGGYIYASAAQLAFVVLLTRLMPAPEAGLFLLSYAVLRVVAAVSPIGFDEAALRWASLGFGRNDAVGITGITIAGIAVSSFVSVLVAFVVWQTAPGIAAAFGEKGLSDVLRLTILSCPALAIRSVLMKTSRATGRMGMFALVDQVAESTLRVSLLAAACTITATAESAAVGLAVAEYATLGIAMVATLPLWWPPHRLGRETLGDVTRFSIFQAGVVLTSSSLLWLDTIMIGFWKDAADVAVYTAATRVVWLGLVFVWPITLAFQPLIASTADRGAFDVLRAVTETASKWICLTAFLPLTMVAVSSEEILRLVFGSQYTPGAPALSLLCFGLAVDSATNPRGIVVTMMGGSRTTFNMSLAALALNIGLNAALIPPYGLTGAGFAWAGSLLALSFLRLRATSRLLGLPWIPSWAPSIVMATLIATTVVATIRFFLPTMPSLSALFLQSSVVAFVYVASLHILGAADVRGLHRHARWFWT